MKPAYKSNEFFYLMLLLIIIAFLLTIFSDCYAQSKWEYIGTYSNDKGNYDLYFMPGTVKQVNGSVVMDLLYEFDFLNLVDGDLFNQIITTILIEPSFEYFSKIKYEMYLDGEYVSKLGLNEKELEKERVDDYIFFDDLFNVVNKQRLTR